MVSSAWAVNAKQANQGVCGEKAQKKNCKKTQLVPPTAGCSGGAAVPTDLCSVSPSAEAQGTNSEPVPHRPLAQHPHPAWAGTATPRDSPEGRDPTGRALGRLRGSIRQTFVIDGHITLAWTPCRGRRWDTG